MRPFRMKEIKCLLGRGARLPAARAAWGFVARIFVLILLVLVPALTGWAADETSAGSNTLATNLLTVAELRCAGAGPEYLEAYRSFLEAGVSDQGPNSYTSAIPILVKAAQGAQNPAVKLRCLLLLVWAQYLNGAAADAHAFVRQSLSQAGQAAGLADKDTLPLDNLKSMIASNSTVRLADLKQFLKVNDEISALMDDLFYMEQSRIAWRQMSALRAEKARMLLETGIMAGGKALGIPDATLEKVKPILKRKYEKRPGIDSAELAADLEDECAKIMLDDLMR